MKSMEENISGISLPILSEFGLELVDLELSRRGKKLWVRMFVDRLDRSGGGVTAEELGNFSRELGRVLDVEELIPESYLLEVSSPGVNRRVRKVEDFVRFAGREASLSLRRPVGGRKHLRGKLIGADSEAVELEQGGEVFRIAHDDIARANLEAEIKPTGAGVKGKKRVRKGD